MKRKVAGSNQDLMYQPPKVQAAAPLTPLVYHNGPILSSPELVSLYWGSFADAEIGTMQSWLGSFASFLSGAQAPSRQEPVVRQYGITGATVGQWYHDPVVPRMTVGWPEIGAKIVNLQNAGNLPPFSSQRLFLTFTKGITLAGFPSIWLGLHGGDPGAPIAICPFPGGSDPMPAWQSVTSHEIMEAATDPQGGSGWIANDGEEGGDLCQWLTINMPFGTVQGFADNRQQMCSVWTKQTVWGGGESLGGNLASQPFALTRGNDRMEVFARASDNTLWHQWWDHGVGWGSGESLGGNLASAPFVLTRGNDRMEVFARAGDNTLWHQWWDHGIGWGAGELLGGNLASAPFVLTRGDNRMEVFARASDNTLWHQWWDHGVGWGSGELLGGNLASAPFVLTRGNDRMEVFARAGDNTLWHQWWDHGIGWGAGELLGGNLASAPFVLTRGDNRMEVFARASDNTLWHRWWDHRIGWGAGESLGGNLASAPFVLTRGNDRMEVFARASDNTLWHLGWDNGVGWGIGESLGGNLASPPFALTRGNNRVEIFAQANDNTLWHNWGDFF
jgi:hypothetical protein